jgi:hypothetical protein
MTQEKLPKSHLFIDLFPFFGIFGHENGYSVIRDTYLGDGMHLVHEKHVKHVEIGYFSDFFPCATTPCVVLQP